MPYTPEQLEQFAEDVALGAGGDPADQAQWISILEQAARDARLRQGVERLRDKMATRINELEGFAVADAEAQDADVVVQELEAEVRQWRELLRALLAETETP